MGLIIKATSMIIGNGQDSSIEISAEAVRKVIQTSGVDRHEVGLLLNIGINRDSNIVEPAVASLIQKRARLNLNPTRKQLGKKVGTLSFDILRGTCGFIQAAQVADAFLQTGSFKKAIIVSSDVHPSGKKVSEFPFTHSAAAILLEYENNGKGFKNYIYETSEKGSVGLKVYMDIMAGGKNGRNLINVDIEEDYPHRLQKFILKTINNYVERGVFNLKEVDHIISATPSKNFGREVSDSLGFRNNTLVEVYDKYGDTNTSSPLIGYHLAAENGELKDGDNVFFISGGSGITCALSMYQV